MEPISTELGSLAELKNRFKAAKSRKDPWVELFRECYEYGLPQRETFNAHHSGEDRQREIFDSTLQVAVKRFVSRLQSILVPPWREWTRFAPGPMFPIAENDEQRLKWEREFDDRTEKFFHYINHSNFATESAEAFGDLSVSTGALYLAEGTGQNVLNFQAVPLSELYLEEGPWGTIENVWREWKVPVRNIERMYPGAKLDDKALQLMKTKPETKITIIEGTLYLPKLRMYQTVVFRAQSDEPIFTQSYEVSPWIVFRWSVTAGEIYGRGPVMDVLPDGKTANISKEFILRNAALNVAGVYTAVDDGVINPYSFSIEPNTIIPVGSNSSSDPTLRPLERAGDPNLAQIVLQDLQTSIKEGLFSSMRTADGPVKSATEIAIDNKELLEQINSAFGRLQKEFIEKVVARANHILVRTGKLGPMEVDGEMVTLRHTSPLAQLQDQADVLVIQQYLELLSALGPEAMMMGVKVEDAPEIIGRKLGVEPELIRGKSEREEMQKDVSQIIGNRGGEMLEAQ